MVSSKQNYKRALVVSLLALAGGAFAPAAGALSVTVAGATTENSVGTNDFFADGVSRIFGVGPLMLALEGAPGATATYTFLFQESSFNNQFIAGGTLVDPGDLHESISQNYAASGAFNFSFTSSLGSVTNAANSLSKPNFGVLLNQNLNSLPAGPVRTALQNQGLLGTYQAILFLNDAGNSEDRDFDDMVIGVNVVAVPEPGTYVMLLAGLVAVFWIGRRRLR